MSILFESTRLKKMTLRNRFVRSPRAVSKDSAAKRRNKSGRNA